MRRRACCFVGLLAASLVACNTAQPGTEEESGARLLLSAAFAGSHGESDAPEPVLRRVWAGGGVTGLGRPTPDGRAVVLTDWSTGNLAVRDLESGETRALTGEEGWTESGGFAEYPVVSADGSRVAYTWFVNTEWGFDLRVIPFEGGTPSVVFKPEGAYVRPLAWTPDGRAIAVVLHGDDGSNRLALVPVDGGDPRVLKTFDWRYPQRVAFSPDGRFLAYDFPPDEDSPHRDVFAIAVDGSRERALVRSPADDVLLGWLPTGEGILFGRATTRQSATEVHFLPVTEGRPGGGPHRIHPGIWQMDPLGFSRDGTYFYRVLTDAPDVYTATVDFETGRVLSPPVSASQGRGSANFGVAWSPDGLQLAYVMRAEQGAEQRIVISSLAGGDEQELAPELAYIGRLTWSADGESLYIAGRDAQNRRGLFRLDLASGRLTTVNPPLDAGRGYFRTMRPSPDGRFLFHIDTAVDVEPAFVIYRMDLSSGEETVLFHPGPHRVANLLSLSPEGDLLAFGEHEGRHDASPVLKIMPADGSGEIRELLRFEEADAIRGIAWTPDGRHILISRREPARTAGPPHGFWLLVPTDGGEPWPLELDMELFPAPTTIQIHPDGRRIGFGAGSFDAELWVMEPISTLVADAGGNE